MAGALSNDGDAAERFRFRHIALPSMQQLRSFPFPSDAEFAESVLLFQQADWSEFPYRDRLPADCVTVRFPSLDSLLLWPFSCANPYNDYSGDEYPGRFPFGDRVILRRVEAGAAADEIISYYLTSWDDYKVDLERVAEHELARLQRRDAECDVAASDLALTRFASEKLFWTVNHPRKPLLAPLLERLLHAGARYQPELARLDAATLCEGAPVEPAVPDHIEVPVHPEIAKQLGLQWYDPQARYRQPKGRHHYTYEEYITELVRYCVARRDGPSKP